MCTYSDGNFYEPPSLDLCDKVLDKAEVLAKEDGKDWDALTVKQQDLYYDAAREVVHPLVEGDRWDMDPEV